MSSSKTPPRSARRSAASISSSEFYSQYHGHPLKHLALLHSNIASNTPIIYLAGDSTLDNKYWLPAAHAASPSPYAPLLSPPLSRLDVAYWLNVLPFRSVPFATLNCAVEATTLRQRLPILLPHDSFISDRIRSNDVLVVSVGGNDIALAPSLSVVGAALAAIYFGGSAGSRTLERLFVDDTTDYIQRLVRKCKPKLVVLCGLYFPDEARVSSWAGIVLTLLLYGNWPGRVQGVMRRVFEKMKTISVEGVRVVHVPLFRVLDGKNTSDYVERVEPSELGGRKIAELLRDVIDDALLEEEGAEG